jgi:dephospho-CoA kinase
VSALRVALTGGIATGKSYCLARFHTLGAPTIDADLVARDVVAPGSPALDAVIARFGRGVLRADGSLDRAALGRIVFADAGARRDLEAIVHPAVYASIRQWFDGLESSPAPPRAAIADIPLLYETGRERDFDRVIVASCRPEQQVDRLVRERGLSRAEAALRLAAQMPVAEKARRADFVVDTSGTFDETDRQIDEVWGRLRRP